MQKCPNCGQEAARTEDWACQWCGYPLFSKFYKRIPKTYRELKEESLLKQEVPVRDEPEPEPVAELEPTPEPEPEPEPVAELEPTPEPEPEPAAELEPTPEPEPEPVAELEPTPEPEPVAELEPEPEPKPKPRTKTRVRAKPKPEPAPVAALEPTPEPDPEPAPAPTAELEPTPEPEPDPAAIELTVEKLLSAYEVEGVAADAKFANKILKVTGTADRIEVKDALDLHYIDLAGAETNELQNVRCFFNRQSGPELSKLTRGQAVTVQGKYDGSIVNLSLRDCVLVP